MLRRNGGVVRQNKKADNLVNNIQDRVGKRFLGEGDKASYNRKRAP